MIQVIVAGLLLELTIALNSNPGGDCQVDMSDLVYYRARIVEEEIAAQRASHPLAANSHKRLAEEYASLLIALNLDAGSELVSS